MCLGTMSAFLRAFDEFFAGSLATFIAISNTIGGDVKEQVAFCVLFCDDREWKNVMTESGRK